MSRKDTQLGESPQSSIRWGLGLMEERESEVASLMRDLNIKEAEQREQDKSERSRENMLQSHVREIAEGLADDRRENKMLVVQLAAARSEIKTESFISETLRSQLEDLKIAFSAQGEQMSRLNESASDLIKERAERGKEQAAFKADLERMSGEQQTLREEMRLAVGRAVSQLAGRVRVMVWVPIDIRVMVIVRVKVKD
jgi:chromosome segregation ATPase